MNVNRGWEFYGPESYKDGYKHVHAELVKSAHETPTFEVAAFDFVSFVGLGIVCAG